MAPGDKIALWVDSTNSAEIATAQIGAMKAGLTVVTIDENDSLANAAQAIKDSNAKALLFSPMTLDESHEKRANALHGLIPELGSLYPGQEFTSSEFPNLKHVIHTGHKTIMGCSKFKETMFYAKMENTNHRIPGVSPEDTALECYQNGNRVASYSNQELVSHAESVHSDYLDGDKPVFVTLSMQYPLALASLIGAAHGQKKVFVPATYSLDEISKQLKMQESSTLICDSGLYAAPAESGLYATPSRVIVGSTSGSIGDSELFPSGVEAKAYL